MTYSNAGQAATALNALLPSGDDYLRQWSYCGDSDAGIMALLLSIRAICGDSNAMRENVLLLSQTHVHCVEHMFVS